MNPFKNAKDIDAWYSKLMTKCAFFTLSKDDRKKLSYAVRMLKEATEKLEALL